MPKGRCGNRHEAVIPSVASSEQASLRRHLSSVPPSSEGVGLRYRHGSEPRQGPIASGYRDAHLKTGRPVGLSHWPCRRPQQAPPSGLADWHCETSHGVCFGAAVEAWADVRLAPDMPVSGEPRGLPTPPTNACNRRHSGRASLSRLARIRTGPYPSACRGARLRFETARRQRPTTMRAARRPPNRPKDTAP